MRVKMLVDTQGHWVDADGGHHEWPLHGTEAELPDDLAVELVRLGHAVEVKTRAPRQVEVKAADPVKPVTEKIG
jgi:hypothetical protein